jgi:HEPN domain-containing protein
MINSVLESVQNTRKRPHELILYHCQQAVEKVLKAYIIYNNNNTCPWGHDLDDLRMTCAGFDNAFNTKRIAGHCAFLTAFNSARYPDFMASVDAKTAERGLNSAKRVYDFVTKRMPF